MLKLLLMGPAPQHQCHQITMSHIKIFQIFSSFSCSLVSTIDAQVPASTAESLRQGAFEELGHSKPQPEVQGAAPSWKKNAQRNAWNNFKRLGIGWKIPMSEFVFDTGEGESLVIPYISPKAYLEFLMNNCLDLVVGGARSPFECSTQLQAFWAAYRQQHSGHQVYRDCPDTGSLGYAVPLALHGDEGRGKRRTGTMAIFLETPLGLPTLSKKRKHCTCSPPAKLLDRFQTGVVPLGTETLKSVARQMMTNTKHHSFLQRWPLIVIPGVVYKAYPKIVDEFHRLLAKEMRILYYERFQGPCGRVYTGVFVGLKADLKWHTKIGTLTRSYENQGSLIAVSLRQPTELTRFIQGSVEY